MTRLFYSFIRSGCDPSNSAHTPTNYRINIQDGTERLIGGPKVGTIYATMHEADQAARDRGGAGVNPGTFHPEQEVGFHTKPYKY